MQIGHTENIIELDHVSFSYGNEVVVSDINLKVHKGDYLGIIGPNGSGKTTLLRLMLGLLKSTHGNIKLFGEDIKRFKDWYKIGYVPQNATYFDKNFPVTVQEVVAMGTYAKRKLFHLPTREDAQKVQKALEEVEMLAYKKKRIGDLSGGQQQRVFIARALASEPEVIFLDEPTVGVDLQTQQQFYSLLQKLNKNLSITLILILHELDVIAKEATEIAALNHALVWYGTPSELMRAGGFEKLYESKLTNITHHHV